VTPLLIAAASAGTNVLLGVLLMGVLGHAGLALANSLAVSAEVLVLLLVLRRRLGSVEGWQTLRVLGRVLISTLLMGLVIGGVLALGRRAGAGALEMVAAGGMAGVLSYAAAGLLLGIEELRRLPSALLGRSHISIRLPPG